MRRSGPRLAAASGLLALVMVAAWPVLPRSDGVVLVRIEKVQASIPGADVVAQLEPIHEFEQAWLVRVPESAASGLQAAGIAHEVLGRVPDGNALFVVSGGDAPALESVRQAGTVWPIDRDAWLVSTRFEDLRERIPAPLHLQRLPERMTVVPTFRLAGRSTAVRRPSVARQAAPAPAIAQMVAEVSSTKLADAIAGLEGFHTRYASLPSCTAAGTWLLDSVTGFGLAAERDPFTFSGYTTHNIVATLPGRTWPDQAVIVSAHYDSYSSDAARLAPGADDDASGTAVVMELARVMRSRSFDYTIKFIAFSAEEYGLLGSKHYAQSARAAGERIVAVVNLDMVGYTTRTPEDLDLMVDAQAEWLADVFVAAGSTYAALPTAKFIGSSYNRTDHAPFRDQGYSAMSGIEDVNVPNPYYHKTTDTLSTLNRDFMTSVARASLATVAALAQPSAWPPPPANVVMQSQTMGSLLLRARSAYLTWSPAAGAAGYHVYRSTASRGSYQRVTTSPLTTTSFADRLVSGTASYYYVVTSIDGNGNEGNHSNEVLLAGTGRAN